MEILNQFGFDLRLFGAQIINFLIIAFVFKKFLYKPLIKTLEDRAKKISKGLKDAEHAQLALEKANEKRDLILRDAGIEAERIMTEAKNQAQKIKEEMMEATKSEIAKMMVATQQQITLEKENFKKESKNMSLEIARTILENTIQGLFDKKETETLIKKGVSKIKNVQ